ncbi:MAG TPA: hemolysin family protein [Pirellulales bacterium]|nr:hemolysin family protein [Pirellulales bacterium]
MLWTLLGVLAVPLLVLFNAFFVATEFALVSLRRTRVDEMINQRRVGAVSVKYAIDNLDDTIATTQLGITLASLALGWVGEPSMARLILPAFAFIPEKGSWIAAHTVATILAFTAITYLHVILGELVPKAVSLQKPDRVSLWLARPLLWFALVMRPFIAIMNGTGNGVLRLLGFEPLSGHQMVHSVDELRMIVEETRRAGILPRDQAEYVRNVFRLPDKKVRDCLVPRERMAALDLHMPEQRILERVRDGAHTRMPVYEGDLDHIVGIVNTKDLFHLFSLRGMVVLDDAMYPAIFVDPQRPISEVLRQFRRQRRPMAVVRDADGKTLGLITLEDIVEEIVGEIEDEHDPLPR